MPDENKKNDSPKEDTNKNNDVVAEKEEENIENKLKTIEEKLLRTLAEMENQRRRFEKERQEAFDFGGFNFAKESLSLLDNMDRATTSFKNDADLKKNNNLNNVIDGIEIVKKDLVSIFKKIGIEPIECLNKKFDPNFHQSMLEIEDETKEPGTVIQEIQKGYIMKDRLLRPSLVGVTKKRAKNNEKKGENNEKNEEKK